MNCPNCNQPVSVGAAFCSACGSQVATPPAAGGENKSGGAKIWLIGCAIAAGLAIPFIGIVAAIVIPNLLSAIQRGRQKRTMGDMKTIASALEQYKTDNGHYPAGRDMQEACKVLTPDYLVQCIYKDGWHSPQQPRLIAYAAWGGDPKNCAPGANPGEPGGASGDARSDRDPAGCGPRHYGLASAGKNGKWAVASFDQYEENAHTESFDADIVLIDGQFTQQPWGKQRNSPLDEYSNKPPVAPAPEPSAGDAFPPPPDPAAPGARP